MKSVDYWLELELCIKLVISGQTDISHKIFNSSARLMQFFFYFLHDFCKYMYLVNVKRFYKREEEEGVNFFLMGVGLFLIMLIFECCTVIQYFPVFLLWKLCSDISQLYLRKIQTVCHCALFCMPIRESYRLTLMANCQSVDKG